MQSKIVATLDRDFRDQRLPWLRLAYAHCDNVISQSMPSLRALRRRKHVVHNLNKFCVQYDRSRAFTIGSLLSGTFIPDEKVEVTVFLCNDQEQSWMNDDAQMLSRLEAILQAEGHQISSIYSDKSRRAWTLNIDDISVSICINNLSGLYSTAIIEDLSDKCLKSGIVKTSILLIKMWCSYDSSKYFPENSGKSVMSLLKSNTIIEVLVLHIFSIFGESIEHPLRALILFLSYFSFIDWETVVISTYALLSIAANTSVVPKDETTPVSQLIEQITVHYRGMYETVMAMNAENIKAKSIAGHDNDNFAGDDTSIKSKYFDKYFDKDVRKQTYGKNSVPTMKIPQGFKKSYMNVMHPILFETNLTLDITLSQVSEIKTALRGGLNDITQAIEFCQSITQDRFYDLETGAGVSIDIGTYFINNLLSNSRKAAMKEHITFNLGVNFMLDKFARGKLDEALFSIEDVLTAMRFAEFVFGSKIDGDTMIEHVVSIVQYTGPHPVGEIGKLLRECSDTPNLCKQIKKQFRGLKHFLEAYPEKLKCGGTHAFNPDVYLADDVTAPPPVMSPPQETISPKERHVPVAYKPVPATTNMKSSKDYTMSHSRLSNQSQHSQQQQPIYQNTRPTNVYHRQQNDYPRPSGRSYGHDMKKDFYNQPMYEVTVKDPSYNYGAQQNQSRQGGMFSKLFAKVEPVVVPTENMTVDQSSYSTFLEKDSMQSFNQGGFTPPPPPSTDTVEAPRVNSKGQLLALLPEFLRNL